MASATQQSDEFHWVRWPWFLACPRPDQRQVREIGARFRRERSNGAAAGALLGGLDVKQEPTMNSSRVGGAAWAVKPQGLLIPMSHV